MLNAININTTIHLLVYVEKYDTGYENKSFNEWARCSS